MSHTELEANSNMDKSWYAVLGTISLLVTVAIFSLDLRDGSLSEAGFVFGTLGSLVTGINLYFLSTERY
jgi:hypothetical protein